MTDLLPSTDEPNVGRWIAAIMAVFLIGAASGGVLFGWLGESIRHIPSDVAERVHLRHIQRPMRICDQSLAPRRFAVYRIARHGSVSGPWGWRWCMEVWPNRSRAWLAGLIGAAANFGYMLIAAVAVVLKELAAGYQLAYPDVLWSGTGFLDVTHPVLRPGMAALATGEESRRHFPLADQRPLRRIDRHGRALGLIALWSI